MTMPKGLNKRQRRLWNQEKRRRHAMNKMLREDEESAAVADESPSPPAETAVALSLNHVSDGERIQTELEAGVQLPAESESAPRPVAHQFLVRVDNLYMNPRMVLAVLEDGSKREVMVGNNRVLWLDAPMVVEESMDHPGYLQIVGELPRGRWDRSYAERVSAAVNA